MKGKRFLSLLLCLVMVLGMLPGLAIPASAADPATIYFYYIMGSTITSDRLKVKAKIGEKVNDWKPASEALEEKDPGYYGVMELVDWYTQAPEENADGSYTFDTQAKVTDDTLVKKGMKLYAKTKVREGQKIAISLSAYTLGETITEWNSET